MTGLLQSPPTKAYFLTAVKRAVLERFRTSYIAQTVWTDDDGLADIEAIQVAQARGRPRVDEVRLPEPGA